MQSYLQGLIDQSVQNAKNSLVDGVTQTLHHMLNMIVEKLGWPGTIAAVVALLAATVLVISVTARMTKLLMSPKGMLITTAILAIGVGVIYWVRPKLTEPLLASAFKQLEQLEDSPIASEVMEFLEDTPFEEFFMPFVTGGSSAPPMVLPTPFIPHVEPLVLPAAAPATAVHASSPSHSVVTSSSSNHSAVVSRNSAVAAPSNHTPPVHHDAAPPSHAKTPAPTPSHTATKAASSHSAGNTTGSSGAVASNHSSAPPIHVTPPPTTRSAPQAARSQPRATNHAPGVNGGYGGGFSGFGMPPQNYNHQLQAQHHAQLQAQRAAELYHMEQMVYGTLNHMAHEQGMGMPYGGHPFGGGHPMSGVHPGAHHMGGHR
jgi:hypothetical protein